MENVKKEEFENKKILEVGSKYVNGSVRPIVKKFLEPKEYIGVDIENGKYIDVIISTELLEHVQDWRSVIINMKNVLKKGG